MINTLTAEVRVLFFRFWFPSTIQLVQHQLTTKQTTFNMNKTNVLMPVTSILTAEFELVLISVNFPARRTSLLCSVTSTGLKYSSTWRRRQSSSAKLTGQNQRRIENRVREEVSPQSRWNPISDCRWPLKMCSSSSTASLSVSALSPTLLFSLLSSKTRWARFSSKTRWVMFSSKTTWVRFS